MKILKIAGASLNQTPFDWNNNSTNILSAIEIAKKENVDILCLPELCITGYGCEDVFLSEWLPKKAQDVLLSIVPYCENIAVAIGLPSILNGQLYNSICLIKNKKIQGFYAKQFLANDGIHYEKRWFSGWKSEEETTIKIKGKTYPFGDITFDIRGLKTGFEICEDAWNADRPACRLYEKGVQLILNPSASHFAFGKSQQREKLVTTSSKSFECYYLYVNHLGNEAGRIIYDGDVLLANKGKLIGRNKRLSFQNFNLLSVEICPDNQEFDTTNIQDGLSSKFLEFPKAASLGLFDYLRKSKAGGYTLSLSGGADSSISAVLVSEMVRNGIAELGLQGFKESLNIDLSKCTDEKTLTANILTTAYQGTINSSQDTLDSAKRLAESIGAKFLNWSIDEAVSLNRETIERALDKKFTWKDNDIVLQNIQARARSPFIWMLANSNNSILLTTSNRSEGDVGYATMDGDTSGSLAPIAGVDKFFISEWLKYAETELGYEGLNSVNNLSPSAELRPLGSTQTDEDDLMPYSILKAIEIQAIFHRKSPIEVYNILNKELDIEESLLKKYIKKFYRLWSINQWKRERLAPSFHLDDFNVDPRSWCRFPILSGGFKEELEKL